MLRRFRCVQIFLKNQEHPVVFGQKRVNMGVGQSYTANNLQPMFPPKPFDYFSLNTLFRYCIQVPPFLARKAQGAPVFGHCPIKNILLIVVHTVYQYVVTIDTSVRTLHFPFQLTRSRFGNFTRLIHTLLPVYASGDRTYYTYIQIISSSSTCLLCQ